MNVKSKESIMLKAKGMLLAAIFALSVLFVSLSHAQDQYDEQEPTPTSQVRIVRLSYAEGTVEMVTDHGRENATMNVPLTEGDQITTGDNGWAEVQLEDGSTIRLAPSTQMTFSELGRASSGATLTTVDLDGGEAEFNVSRHHDDQFAVTVGPRTILLDHSGRFRVTSSNQDPLELVVFKGAVKLKDPDSGEQVAVKKGETFTLDPMDSAHYALDKEAEADDLDDWSQQRDNTLNSYASAAASNNSPRSAR
ncbi:MAG TPA: FecR family protein [Candidatus Angelobacter sp.]|nr:FecR family protein [Candidatus Angelobacter sp.]